MKQQTKFKETEIGMIPEEWNTVKLSDLTIRITKGTTPTTIGGRFVEKGINFIKVESLNDDGTINQEKFMYIDEETNNLLARSKLQKNDLLFTIAGTIGRVSIVRGDILPANTNQAVAILRPDLSKINLSYLRYALVNPDVKTYLLSKVVHAVQANLSLAEIGNCPIPIPEYDEQSAIAKILSNLDSKIELNQQMNKKLETMGQGIFGTSSTKIMFTLSDSNDTNRMLDSMGVQDKEQREFARLISKEERQMLVKFSSRYNQPFIATCKTPRLKGFDEVEITKEEKRRNNSRFVYLFQAIKPRKPYGKNKEEEKEQRDDKRMEDVKDALRSIYSEPFMSSELRCDYLKFNNTKANRIFELIESEGYANPVYLNLKGRGGQTKFFWPTEKGCKLIDKPRLPEGSGGKSSTHIFLQGFLAKHLKNKGCKQVEIEKNIEGKKIDLFCIKDDKKIGIEICVSTQKTEHINIEKDKDKCDRLIIVCLDNNEQKKLIEQLGEMKNNAEIYALYEFLKAI